MLIFFFFSSRRRHTRLTCDWSSDVCSSDLFIVNQAKEERDRAFVISAYLRLCDLLERAGQPDEALETIERCLLDYGAKKKGPAAPTETQRAMLENRKAHLTPLLAK